MPAPWSSAARAAAPGWALTPLTVAAIHFGALLVSPWLAAGAVACDWPQAWSPLPAWGVGFAMLVAALISLPLVDSAFSESAGRRGFVRRTLVGAAFSLALILAGLLTVDASLSGLTLMLYFGLVVVADSLRRLLLAPALPASARPALQTRLAAYLDRAPYAAWLMAALFVLVVAGLNYVLGREPNAERLVNWTYGFLTLGVSAGLLQEFVKPTWLPDALRRRFGWLAPVGVGALIIGAGLLLEKSDALPSQSTLSVAASSVVRYLNQNTQPGDVVLVRGLPVGLRCYGFQPAALVELQPGGNFEAQVAAATTHRRRVFFVFPTDINRNRRAERLALEKGGDLIEQIPGPLAVEVYAVGPWVDLAAGPALDANYGPLSALSAAMQPEVSSGAALGVSLQVRLNGLAGEDYLTRLALLDAAGETVAATDDFLLNPAGQHTSKWTASEPVEDDLLMPVPLGTPPGTYRLALGFLGLDHPAGFPLLNRAALADSRLLVVGEVQVRRPSSFERDPYATLPALQLSPLNRNRAWPGIRLLAYRPIQGEILPGDSLPLLFQWEALQAAPALSPAQLRLLAGTHILAQRTMVLGGDYPSSAWQAGELILDRLGWQTPPDAPPGPATVQLSLDGTEWDDVGRVNLKAIDRSFDAPQVEQAAVAQFGQIARLAGYDVKLPDTTNGPVAITLNWQATNSNPIPTRYKVFVHALGPDGQILAQSDAEPAAAARPTTSWVAGEYIVDKHLVALPAHYAGPVTWRIGLYAAETLARVPVANGDYLILPSQLTVPAQ